MSTLRSRRGSWPNSGGRLGESTWSVTCSSWLRRSTRSSSGCLRISEVADSGHSAASGPDHVSACSCCMACRRSRRSCTVASAATASISSWLREASKLTVSATIRLWATSSSSTSRPHRAVRRSPRRAGGGGGGAVMRKPSIGHATPAAGTQFRASTGPCRGPTLPHPRIRVPPGHRQPRSRPAACAAGSPRRPCPCRPTKTNAPSCAVPPSSTTSFRRPARWPSPPPSRWSTSATWRWPTRPAWPRPAKRSWPTRPTPTATPRAATWWPWSPTARRCWAWATSVPLAAKPVMEGKGVLFKKFAGIDVFDLELQREATSRQAGRPSSPRFEPTFGGINLEDIKAPDCFYVERKLRERMKIPVFHDDQHGTAIVVGAALLNALEGGGQGHSATSSWCPAAPRRGCLGLPGPAGEAGRHRARTSG